MAVLILVVLLLVAGVLAAAAAGVGSLAAGRDRDRRRLPGVAGVSVGVLAGGAILLVAVALVAVALVGMRGSSVDESPAGDRAAPPASRATGGAVLGPVVWIRAEEPEADAFPPPAGAVDGLEPDTVLRLRVDGFEPFARARARQCVAAGAGRAPSGVVAAPRCGNSLEVQFGAGGSASFQYLVVDDFVEAARRGRCRARATPCSIVVDQVEGEGRGEIVTVFHDRLPPPGRIRVSPRTGLADGQTVTVEATGYPPGSRLQAVLCAAPATTGAARCGSPGPGASLTVGPAGTARTTLTVRAGPVGGQQVVCGRRTRCGVSVTAGTALARAAVVPITFAGPPGADYDPARLGGGLVAAALLVGLAAWLVRRTDWSAVGEAAAPEIDDAEYADLDALVAALPPEDDLDEEFVPTPRT